MSCESLKKGDAIWVKLKFQRTAPIIAENIRCVKTSLYKDGSLTYECEEKSLGIIKKIEVIEIISRESRIVNIVLHSYKFSHDFKTTKIGSIKFWHKEK